MFLWYVANMPAKPVQVSIDLDLLRRIDADPETRERGRSAFIRAAATGYLRAKRLREIDATIAAAYADAADAVLVEAASLMEAQEWPED